MYYTYTESPILHVYEISSITRIRNLQFYTSCIVWFILLLILVEGLIPVIPDPYLTTCPGNNLSFFKWLIPVTIDSCNDWSLKRLILLMTDPCNDWSLQWLIHVNDFHRTSCHNNYMILIKWHFQVTTCITSNNWSLQRFNSCNNWDLLWLCLLMTDHDQTYTITLDDWSKWEWLACQPIETASTFWWENLAQMSMFLYWLYHRIDCTGVIIHVQRSCKQFC